MSRHALVDLSQVLNTPPRSLDRERLAAAELRELRKLLANAGFSQLPAAVASHESTQDRAQLEQEPAREVTQEHMQEYAQERIQNSREEHLSERMQGANQGRSETRSSERLQEGIHERMRKETQKSREQQTNEGPQEPIPDNAQERIGERPSENAHRLNELRRLYEPYAHALSERLLMPIGNWTPEKHITENWRTSAWARISGDLESSPLADPDEKSHF